VTDPVERAVAALHRETTVRGLLETASREITETLEASACMISRVVGDLLVSLVEFSRGERAPDIGHEYLISDYPLTHEVITAGEPRAVSLLDEDPEPTEAELLEKLGFESLLMVCMPSGGSCWGLVEVYGEGIRFDDGQAGIANSIALEAGRQLERFAPQR
jgi:GAF domain-containing protein